MGERQTRRGARRTRWVAAARIALAFAALAPAAPAPTAIALERSAPAPAEHGVVLATAAPSREAAEWTRLRLRRADADQPLVR